MNIDTKNIDVVILCGGVGKRLKSIVNDRPKPMAEIKGRPFLDWLIDYVSSYEFHRFILSTGYMSEFIRDYYKNKLILFSKEKNPLGTAGAVKNSQRFIRSNPFLVMNGDSICRLDLRELLEFHIRKNALVSIALTTSGDVKNSGTVKLNDKQQIVRFSEKVDTTDSSNIINAGVYAFDQEVLSLIPNDKPYSLEYDLFPQLKRCYGYVTDKDLIDIGTPEGYERARQLL